MLEIAARPTAADVVRSVATTNNTPLYHLLLHALPGLNDAPLIARLLSAELGLLTVLLAARAALVRWGLGPSLVATSLVSLSAVAVHFSSEIRPYALLSFLVLVALEAVDHSFRGGTRPLVVQGFAMLLAIGFHPYGLVLLGVGPSAAWICRRSELRRQLALTALVLLPTAPFFLWQARALPPEASEYLSDLWRGHAAITTAVVLLRDLLPSAHWPSGIALPDAPGRMALEIASATLVAVLAGAAVRRRDVLRTEPFVVAVLAFVGGTAVAGLIASLAGHPVAVPGRFACALVAPFAILVARASAFDAVSRAAAACLVLVALLTNAESLAHPERRGVRPEALAAAALRRSIGRPSLLVTVGLTGVPLRYLLRDLPQVRFRSFPLDLEEHISWWAPNHLQDRPESLDADVARLSREVEVAARSGRQLFLEGADHPVAARLRSALETNFVFRPISLYNQGLFELVPREDSGL